MKVKKKIIKKKLKEPDELTSFTQRSYLFLKKHLKRILALAILVLILFSSFFLYRAWDEKNEEEASQKLTLALDLYSKTGAIFGEGASSDPKVALKGFEEVVKSYARTEGGRYALLYKGTIHLGMGEYDEAIQTYLAFLKRGSKEVTHRVIGLMGLGYAYEGKKEYEKAANTYIDIIKLGEAFEWTGAHLNLARCYEKLGKKSEAIENYKAFLKRFPKSPMANLAFKKVSSLE